MSKTADSIKRAVQQTGVRGPSPKGAFNTCCPFCIVVLGKADLKFKLELDPAKGLFHCHKCETGGRTDLSWMKRAARGPVQQVAAESMSQPHGYFPIHSTLTSAAMQPYYKYLLNRGVTAKMCEELEIGACVTGKYAGRIIVPQFRTEAVRGKQVVKRWNGFVTRAIYPSMEPKYLYPRGMDRRTQVWGTWLPWQETLFVVEGVFDALALYPCGLATYGKNITDDQLEVLSKLTCRELVFALDGDAWQDAQVAAMRLLLRLDPDSPLKVRWAKLPPGQDPGVLGQDVRKFIQPG